MFIRKLTEKIILWFKSLFRIKDKPDINTLRDISYMALTAYKQAKGEIQCQDVLKIYKEIEFSADIMRYTCIPEVFISNYSSLFKSAETLKTIKVTKSELKEYNLQINNMINSISQPCKSAEDENILYGVTFRNKRKPYYYLGGDKEYAVGQYVIAPAGRYFEPAVVKIVKKGSIDDEILPVPKEFLKTITSSAV